MKALESMDMEIQYFIFAVTNSAATSASSRLDGRLVLVWGETIVILFWYGQTWNEVIKT